MIQDLQSRVAQFVQQHGLETGIEARLLDLLSELGELAKEALKGSQYGQSEYSRTPDWEDELADVFFSLVCIANSTGVDLEQALDTALLKYSRRIQERGEAGSGK